MNDADRARLERATQHPLYHEAMRREPSDYAVPVALLALFYLAVPVLFVLPVLAGDPHLSMNLITFFFASLSAWPFVWGVTRTWPLRSLPRRHVLGVVVGPTTVAKRGKWVEVEPAAGAPVALRLRLRAYLDATGGAVGAGSVGVALCKGDQMVEWVAIPDVAPSAEPAPGTVAP